MNRDKRMQCLVKQLVRKTGCTEQDAQRYIRIVLDDYTNKYISTLFEDNYQQLYYSCLSEHYLIKGDLQKSTEYICKSTVTDKSTKNDKTYLVIFNWSTDNNSDVEVHAFAKYANALRFFKELVKTEKETSWVVDIVDNDENIVDGYHMDEYINTDDTKEYNCWWYANSVDDKSLWSYIDLKAVPMQYEEEK